MYNHIVRYRVLDNGYIYDLRLRYELNMFNFISDSNDIQELNMGENSCILLGDSLKILKSFNDKSVNLIFADPPYNIGKDFGNNKDKLMCKCVSYQ